MSNEEWLPVKGYEGVYSISNFGNVRRDKKGCGVCVEGRILKPIVHRLGYLQIDLRNNNRKTVYIHNLVASAFIGDKEKGFETNHIDRNRSNNHLSNLEYLTVKENKPRGMLNGHSKLNDEKVRLIRTKYFDKNQRELSEMFNVSQTVISEVINNKTWKHVR